jgi:uracil-DNA glycosylase
VNELATAHERFARVRQEAAGCTRCPLYRLGTQTVFGEGLVSAAVMLVGEQPGDQEDLQGRPFVGPAGRLLNASLEAAAIDRTKLYVTNAVKHFKYEPRGKRRIHKKPSASEIDHCKWWLDLELQIVQPQLVVAMGSTAARSLLQRPVTIESVRGQPLPLGPGRTLLVTVHPSFLLRLTDPAKERESERFVADLKVIAKLKPVVGRAA